MRQRLRRSQRVVWALLARGPVDRDHTSEGEHHSDFGLDIRQEIGNPPRGVGVPINERWIAGRKISVNPEGRPRQRDDPTDDDCLAHALARSLDHTSRRSRHDRSVWPKGTKRDASRAAPINPRSRYISCKSIGRYPADALRSPTTADR